MARFSRCGIVRAFPALRWRRFGPNPVLYTGRTTRAALDALFDNGRPRSVQLCALIDRGHRELPIEARFVGKLVQTTDCEMIEVKLDPIDGEEKVLLLERVDESPGEGAKIGEVGASPP